jgi:sodium transport system ATP-binding protein
MIEVDNITKRFGPIQAVKNLSFSVEEGEVFGLLGPNGAGKTTTLRILATLLKADTGTATIGGLDIVRDAEGIRRSIGVVNGGMGLYDRLSGREILHYFGKLYGMKRGAIEARIRELDDLLELGETLVRRAGGFSTGMKQKIVIARAVLHDPPVIFFDEATSGLDVMARRAVLDFVKGYASFDRAVIYSTHVMSEIEELCKRVAVVYRGELIALEGVDTLRRMTGADSLEQAFFRIIESSDQPRERLALT